MDAAKEIFFIADDFGMSAEVNEAIIHAYQNGVLHGAALMMGQPGTDEAVQLAWENPELKIGFHWHITDSCPMTMNSWPWSSSPAGAGFSVGLSSRRRLQVIRELEAQWEAFAKSGLPCAFANSHHHLHIHPFLLRSFLEKVKLAEGGWIRLGDPRFFDRPDSRLAARFAAFLKRWGLGELESPVSPDTLWGIDRTFQMQAREVERVISELPSGRHEFIFHPRSVNQDMDMECLLALKESEKYQ